MAAIEVNFDGLVGPTHHYAGLAPGNLASTENAFSVANPRAAALEGLAKMRLLMNLGVKQGVFPPHQRPHGEQLRHLGFTGTLTAQITTAYKEAPELLSACYSASSMWTANTATVAVSADTNDSRVHFTAANLVNNLHRQLESSFSTKILRTLFKDENYFCHHPALPPTTALGDEGAANHSRIASSHQNEGINLFVYGTSNFKKNKLPQLHYPARQTLEASMTVARLNQLRPEKTLFAQQRSIAINNGVFHNDVISVANESVLLAYEQAWVNQESIISQIRAQANFELIYLKGTKEFFSLDDAVRSYLYNSQLITTEAKKMTLIAPIECRDNLRIQNYINHIISDQSNPIDAVYFLNLQQSMRNGGGPACLRLRVPLNSEEFNTMHQGVLLTPLLLEELENWVVRYYRQELCINDLSDPNLVDEVYTALDRLTQILKLGAIYPFQHAG